MVKWSSCTRGETKKHGQRANPCKTLSNTNPRSRLLTQITYTSTQTLCCSLVCDNGETKRCVLVIFVSCESVVRMCIKCEYLQENFGEDLCVACHMCLQHLMGCQEYDYSYEDSVTPSIVQHIVARSIYHISQNVVQFQLVFVESGLSLPTVSSLHSPFQGAFVCKYKYPFPSLEGVGPFTSI